MKKLKENHEASFKGRLSNKVSYVWDFQQIIRIGALSKQFLIKYLKSEFNYKLFPEVPLVRMSSLLVKWSKNLSNPRLVIKNTNCSDGPDLIKKQWHVSRDFFNNG